MKRLLAVILVLAMMCGINVGRADNTYQIREIIKLEGEPVRYFMEYCWSDDEMWRSDSYWNLVDAEGRTIKENFAKNVYEIEDGKYEVKVGNLWGVMDQIYRV